MSRKYRLGKRFRDTRVLCIVAELMVIYVFSLLYRLLFPGLNGFVLGVACAAAGALIAWGTWRLLGWVAGRYWYQPTDEGLSVRRGGKTRLYRWDGFAKATVDRFALRSALPVEFVMKDGSRFGIDSYIEGIGSLTLDILKYLEGRAEIDPDLLERIETARAFSTKYKKRARQEQSES